MYIMAEIVQIGFKFKQIRFERFVSICKISLRRRLKIDNQGRFNAVLFYCRWLQIPLFVVL